MEVKNAIVLLVKTTTITRPIVCQREGVKLTPHVSQLTVEGVDGGALLSNGASKLQDRDVKSVTFGHHFTTLQQDAGMPVLTGQPSADVRCDASGSRPPSERLRRLLADGRRTSCGATTDGSLAGASEAHVGGSPTAGAGGAVDGEGERRERRNPSSIPC
jgi:hypothetical protein